MAKMTWVKATQVLQKPDKTWAKIGDVFEVPADKVSKRSMEKPTDQEVKAAKAATPKPKLDAKDARIAELESELADAKRGRDIAFEAADLLQVEVGDLKDAISKLKQPPPKAPSLAGEAKKDG